MTNCVESQKEWLQAQERKPQGIQEQSLEPNRGVPNDGKFPTPGVRQQLKLQHLFEIVYRMKTGKKLEHRLQKYPEAANSVANV